MPEWKIGSRRLKLAHRSLDHRVPKGAMAIPVRKANAGPKANVDYKASGVRRESAVHRVSGVPKASEVCQDPQEQKGIKVIQVRKDRRDRS